MKTRLLLIVALALAGGAGLGWWLRGGSANHAAPDDRASPRQPLYWVAPMDPNFRSDRPGKSPMGMDLVPVYEEDSGDEAPGTVRITPDVQHNLGVRVAQVQQGVLNETIDLVGFVEFDESKVSHVHSRVEGWIERLDIEAEGDAVRAGEMLFSIYSPTLVKAQEEYLLAREGSSVSLRTASQERLLALGMTRAQVADLQAKGRVLQNVPVSAGGSGVVTRLNVREGMFVKPELEIMTIGALDTVWVTGELFERESLLVREGQPMEMRLGYLPGRVWSGTVTYVYPVVDVSTRSVRVRMVVDNSDAELKPGMFGDVTIAVATAQPVLSVPREAVIRGVPQDRVVLALDDERFRAQPVTIGREIGDRLEVLAGLSEDAWVVVSAQFLIDSESNRRSDLERMDHAVAPDSGAGHHHD
ncbi:MAG: efflux RND transporter periplasmic adaptor subunit [Pseudomonadales bacterium]